jgi:hypothetical protein
MGASAGELGFSVERSSAGPFTVVATTAPGVTSYTDVSVVDGTIYCYRVRAFNSVAYSQYSNLACGISGPAGLTLTLATNQQTVAPGDWFQVGITVANEGPPVLVDMYGGSILPATGSDAGCADGDAVSYLVDPPAGLGGFAFRCLTAGPEGAVPMYRGVSMATGVRTTPDLVGFNWPMMAAGNYTMFMFFTQAGTSNVVGLGTATFSSLP